MIKPKKEDISFDESDVIRHLRPIECLLFFFLSKCRLRYPFKGIPKSVNQGAFAVALSKAKSRWKKTKSPGDEVVQSSLRPWLIQRVSLSLNHKCVSLYLNHKKLSFS